MDSVKKQQSPFCTNDLQNNVKENTYVHTQTHKHATKSHFKNKVRLLLFSDQRQV